MQRQRMPGGKSLFIHAGLKFDHPRSFAKFWIISFSERSNHLLRQMGSWSGLGVHAGRAVVSSRACTSSRAFGCVQTS